MLFKDILNPQKLFNRNAGGAVFMFNNIINFINMIKYKKSSNDLKYKEKIHLGVACVYREINTKDINIIDYFYFKYDYSKNISSFINLNQMIPYSLFNLFSYDRTIYALRYFDVDGHFYYIRVDL